MKKYLVTITLLTFLTTAVLFLVFLKINSNKYRLLKNQVLTGIVDYAADPAGFYKKTLINTFPNQPDWNVGEQFGTANQPPVSAESAIIVELNTGRVLYEKSSTQKMKIASITKIMTAVVALEHKKLSDKIYVSRHAAYIGDDTMYLSRGEVYTLRELLYGLLLNSGNDAAYAIAEGVAGDSNTFVKWMNIKAEELSLKDTLFTDPSGLDDDTYSTAVDLVKLSRYAEQSPDFKDIDKTLSIELTSDTHKYVYLENQTNLLKTYPGVTGIKIGYTEAAGLCLVTYASNGGHELVGVVLNSLNRKIDMIRMLDYTFPVVGIEIGDHL